MAAKALLVLCASALFVQSTLACCGGCGSQGGLGGLDGLGAGAGWGCGSNVAVASGGGLPVCTYSPISPSGISVRSENSIQGPLEICGALPLLSAVAFEGTLATAGSAGVQYSCGNGNVGITSADNSAGLYGGAGLSGAAGWGGWGSYGGGCGCGC